MKTVQLLYSYLLVENPFNLEGQPTSPTKEKRFAYGLYLDTIYLIDELARQVVGKNKSLPLVSSRFVMKTESDEKIKSLKVKYSSGNYPLAGVEPSLKEAIKGSLLFKEFEKNRDKGEMTEDFWENVFKSIILPNESYNNIVKTLPDYTLAGVERMKDMMESTFRNFYSSKDNIDDALRTLEKSMQKARDLYMRLIALPVELTRLRSDQIEHNRKKLLAGVEDLNPNLKFVENSVAALLEKNPEFDAYTDDSHLSWRAEDPELLEILLKAILDSEIYKAYEKNPERSIEEDSEFWQHVLTDIILNNEHFLDFLENKSVFWNDDLEIMASFAIKTFKRLENPETQKSAVLPMYKDGEHGKDARFGAELFGYVVKNKDLYRSYIRQALERDKWEAERLAFMDVVIVMTALAEIINYPEIPLNVSINEYIEIAKSYSSAKSGQFVHGLLASIISKLKEEKILIK